MIKGLICTAILLSGCTEASRAVVNEAVETVKQAEDSRARLALQAPCAMTVGAKNRVLSEHEKRHVEALCGGSTERPLTIEEVQRHLTTLR